MKGCEKSQLHITGENFQYTRDIIFFSCKLNFQLALQNSQLHVKILNSHVKVKFNFTFDLFIRETIG